MAAGVTHAVWNEDTIRRQQSEQHKERLRAAREVRQATKAGLVAGGGAAPGGVGTKRAAPQGSAAARQPAAKTAPPARPLWRGGQAAGQRHDWGEARSAVGCGGGQRRARGGRSRRPGSTFGRPDHHAEARARGGRCRRGAAR